MSEQINPEVITALSSFNQAYKNNQIRTEKIAANREKMKALKPQVDEFNKLQDEVKEMLKLNDKDRNYVLETIEFYESATGNAVETGDLFTKNKED